MPAAEAGRPISLEASQDLFEILSFHAHVALAVSGGGDSTALMWLVARWAKASASAPKISVLTVDHGLRPEAKAECAKVRAWAAALGLEAHILTATGTKPQSGLQEKARELRYGLMRAWCLRHGASLIVTAHTLEDQAETLLMRLARGSGIRGLSGMRASEAGPVRIERPLIETKRSDLRATLIAARQPWIEDPSNEDQRFERVRIRKAQPLLDELGLTAQALARSAARLERALVPLDEMALSFIARDVEVRPEGFALIERQAFHKLDDEIAIQVLERLLGRLGGQSVPPRLKALEALDRWLRRGESEVHTLAGCRIAQRKRQLLIGREAGRSSAVPVAVAAGETVLWDNRFRVAIEGTDEPCAIVPVKGLGLERNPAIPAFVQDGLPAILAKGEIAAVPALGLLRQSAPKGLRATAEFQKIGP